MDKQSAFSDDSRLLLSLVTFVLQNSTHKHMSIIEQAKAFVTDFFEKNHKAIYTYHNIDHTENVVKHATKIAGIMEFSEEDIEVVVLAAWFHDAGYVNSIENHEEEKWESKGVINKNNGIIHHKKLCSNHLPIDKNISDSNYYSSKIRFHKSKKIPILDLIAQKKSAEDAIELLLLAADGNPTSVHIYDKLITLFGKIKRYESIQLLLKSVEDELSQILSEKKGGTKEHKKYQKAFRHIQGQKEKALKNARNRAIAKCGPICLGETT